LRIGHVEECQLIRVTLLPTDVLILLVLVLSRLAVTDHHGQLSQLFLLLEAYLEQLRVDFVVQFRRLRLVVLLVRLVIGIIVPLKLVRWGVLEAIVRLPMLPLEDAVHTLLLMLIAYILLPIHVLILLDKAFHVTLGCRDILVVTVRLKLLQDLLEQLVGVRGRVAFLF
jgi:hypothetical protein